MEQITVLNSFVRKYNGKKMEESTLVQFSTALVIEITNALDNNPE